MRIVFSALAIIVALGLGISVRAEVSPEKERAIRRLMELTGATEIGSQLASSLLGQLRPMFPNGGSVLNERPCSPHDLTE